MRHWLIWTTSGVAAGAPAIIVVVALAGAGHGTYFPAALLFPFTMLLALWVGTISPPLVALALVQYPVYGLLLAKLKGSQQALQYVFSLHAIAALIAGIAVAMSDGF